MKTGGRPLSYFIFVCYSLKIEIPVNVENLLRKPLNFLDKMGSFVEVNEYLLASVVQKITPFQPKLYDSCNKSKFMLRMHHMLWQNTFCFVRATSRIDNTFLFMSEILLAYAKSGVHDEGPESQDPGHLQYIGLDT